MKTKLKNSIKKQGICIALFFSFFNLNAQYTEVINSNKPGFSESPYSVGSGVYQFESNIFYRKTNINSIFSRPESLGFDLFFRTSILSEKLEINTQIIYERTQFVFQNLSTVSRFKNSISQFSFGAKYLIHEQKYTDKTKEIKSWKKRIAFDYKRLLPSVAIYIGYNTNMVGEGFERDKATPKVGVLFQNNLNENFNIISNVYYNYIGSLQEEMSYIITATYNLGNRWSTFLENQSIYKTLNTDVNLGTGLVYLFNKNLQINASGRILFEGNTTGFFGGLGVSYRIDNHRDSYKELDPYLK